MKMKKYFFAIILLSSIATAQTHSIFTNILQMHVKNGLVDYKNLKKDARLGEYINLISQINPDTIRNGNDALAFWINAYNAYTLKIICDNYPIESINDLHTGGQIIGHVLGTTVWDKKLVTINGKETTLNFLEHDVIRKKFKEPRIHFALVCAAFSCPPLRNEAFEGFLINSQLKDQAIQFFNDKTKNKFEMTSKTAAISKILDWYESDFGKNDEEIIKYISQFLSDGLKLSMQKNPERWQIKYLPYSWDLNEAK